MTRSPEQAQRIRDLFRLMAEVSDPDKLKELKAELRHLLVGQAPLQPPSPRQLRIVEMVGEGLKNREIAQKLGITTQVVKNYLRCIYAKIGINNRLELALWYQEQIHEGKLRRRADSLNSR